MPIGIIWDLDKTLIDSKIAQIQRNRRNWNEVYKLIPEFKIYDGIVEVLQYIEDNNIESCIVTSSPMAYATKVANMHNFNIKNIIAYHDTARHKPDPQPIIAGIRTFESNPNYILSIGDALNDVIAAKRARDYEPRMISVAAMWDTTDFDSIVREGANHICNSPSTLIRIIEDYAKY